MTSGPEPARILIDGADAALHGLLEEWLAEHGCEVVAERPDLIVVDLPLPRRNGADAVKRLGARHPGTPLVALSSNFFDGVQADGAIARALGVSAVLPKPLKRAALLGALRRLLPQLE